MKELFQFAGATGEAESADGFAAERFILFAFCGRQEAGSVAVQQIAANDGTADRFIIGGGVDIVEQLVRLVSAEHAEVFDGFALQLWIGLATGDVRQDIHGLRLAALRKDEEEFRFILH